MRALLLAVTFLALVPLSGCLSGGGGKNAPDGAEPRNEGGAPVSNATRLEALLDAIPAGANETSDWVLLTAVAGPERPLQGFRWTLPQGAAYEGPGGWTLDLEAAVLTPDGELDNLRRVIVQGFKDIGTGLYRDGDGLFARGVFHEIVRTDAGAERTDYEPPWDPSYFAGKFYVPYDGDPTGTPVYFVLAAEATEPTEIAVALRTVRDNDEWEALDGEERGPDPLRARADSTRPKLLERMGNGTGFHFPQYVDTNHAYLDPAYTIYEGYERWTDDVEIVEGDPSADHRPLGGARNVTLSYDFASESGWGYASGYYYNSIGGATLRAGYDVHGEAGAIDVAVLPWGPALAAYFLRGATGQQVFGDLGDVYTDAGGVYGFEVQQEGDGGGSARLAVQSTSTTAVQDATVLVGLEFGATLEELLGVPSHTYERTYP